MKKASLVIRTYNEEKWVRHCLEMVFLQTMRDFDVVIVDNNSTDKTIEIVKRFEIKKIINIKNYKPGLSLNMGVLANKAEYYVFLSSHCIPTSINWLSNLINTMENNFELVGCYGRQLPLPFSEDIDKRDLYMTFSCESRTSRKDSFFHNANSIIRGNYLEDNLFDPDVNNAEDHLWGQKVIKNKLQLAYNAEASVYHHHGLHQGSKPKRVSGVLKQLEKGIDDELIDYPYSLTSAGTIVHAIVIIPDYLKYKTNELIKKFSSMLCDSNFIKKVYIIVPNNENNDTIKNSECVELFERSSFLTPMDKELLVFLNEFVEYVETKDIIPDNYLYLNASYINGSIDLINKLINAHIHSSNDITHVGEKTYECIWAFSEDEGYKPVSDDFLAPKTLRNPLYKIFYGLGSILRPQVIRGLENTKLISGLYELDDNSLTIREK